MSNVFGYDRQKWMVLSATSLGAFLFTINISIVNLALPLITTYYQAPLSSVEWVSLIYLLLMSSLMLTFGRLGDLYGHKPIYVGSIAVFTLGAVFCIFAPSILTLIAARGLQSIGAGMAMAVVQAIIADNFPATSRGRAIGINAIFVSLGLAAGPSFGGLLLSYCDWRIIFIINVPLGIIGTLWTYWVLPAKKGSSQILDIPGASFLFVTLMCALLYMTHGQEWGWVSPFALVLLALSCLSFIFFIRRELTFTHPMVKLALFKNRLFTASNIAAVLNYTTQYIVTFLMPFYLLNIIKLSSDDAGLVMATFPVAMMLVSPFSGVISDKIGAQLPASIGMGLIAVSSLILSSVTPADSLFPVVFGLILAGAGTALFVVPNNDAIMGSVPQEQIGLASGMIATMRSIGQALGIAVCGAVFSSRLAYYVVALGTAHDTGSALYEDQIFTLAQHDTYLVALVIALVGMAVSLVRGVYRKNG